MSISHQISGPEASIAVSGQFNFSQHKAFRSASKEVLKHHEVKSIEINLLEVDYLDSSALGMLLVLREEAHQQGVQRLLISNVPATIKQILSIARFEKFFQID